MTDSLEIRLLGPFEVVVRGRPVDVSGAKRRGLLALLALRPGRVVAVDLLVDALWGADLPAAPRNALQHHVTRLRSVLGPEAITAAPDGYALEGAVVDTLQFEELLAAARSTLRTGDARAAADTVARALDLWRGPALLGLLDADWASAEAGRLEALRLDALEDRFEAALVLGEHAALVPEIPAALDDNPFRERLWGQLMLALYRSGRQADALETFQDARRVLSGRLGIEPGPELQRLQAAILAHDATIAAVPVPPRRRGNLPASVSSFVGRKEALAEVLQLLGEHRLVTLSGPPGVGKSRLALEAARSIEDGFPGGVWLVELARAARAADVARVTAQAIDARGPVGKRDAAARVVDLLRDTDALLLLDDCSRVVGEAARLAAAVLAECPGVRVLATSREVLHLPGEIRVNVAPLAVADADAAGVDELARSEAVQLFAERARASRPGFPMTAESARIVGEICRRLDGLPLAIELAAARVNVLGLREILVAAEHRSTHLSESDPSNPEAHRYGATLVAWSYDLLHADEKTLLHQLAVFRGGAPLPAVLAAAARQELDEATVTHLLGALVDKSIVAASFPDGEPRYDLLETVREYVLERLAESGGLATAHMAHAEYFAAMADEAREGLRGRDHLAWTRRLEREYDNLWAALAYAHDVPDPDTPAAERLELLAHLCYFATEQLDLGAALEAGERGLALARPGAARQETALVQVALALAVSGDGRRAAALTEEARAGHVAAGDHWGVVSCDLVSAVGAVRAGDVQTVATLTSEILRRSGATGYEPFHVWGMLLEAWVAERRNERAATAAAYRRVLDVAGRAGLAHHAAFALAGLGSSMLASGDVAQAEALQRRAAAAAEAARAPWVAAHARVQLARTLEAAGDSDTAEGLYWSVVDWSERARLQQARETFFVALVGSPAAAALFGLAELAAARGEAAAADELRARAAAQAELDLERILLDRVRAVAVAP